MVGDELGWCPVEVLRAGLAEHDWRKFVGASDVSCEQYFKFYIQSSVGLVGCRIEIRKGLWVVWWARGGGDAEGFEGGQGGDPGGDGGGKVFGKEWAEGLGLPGLEIAGGPVVEQADAEDVVGGMADGDWRAQGIGLADV